MKIKFCGATIGVTGSCHLISTDRHMVLLDCGQFQGNKEMDALNYEDFPFDPKAVECVVLSHAHIDHCGRLPLLVKRGFKGDIYCTDATADLLSVMLLDSAYIHEKDAEWQTKKNARTAKPAVEPLYTIITEIWVTEGDSTSKIVFSGDLGVKDRPILRDPKKIKKADYLIMESTYGNRLHPENSTSIDRLIEITLDTVKRGGSVIIPAFAVGRTQELIYEFNMFYEHHPEYSEILDKINVYVDSPMATTATEVFRKNAQVFDDETKEYILSGDNPLDFKNLKFTRSTEESQALNTDKTPKIIISASGMCEAGRIRHHLKHNLWDPKNSIVFVGYQAEGTLGRAIIDGATEVKLFGETVLVKAEIHNLEGFSGHADQAGLLDWLSGFQKIPKKIFLVHGEEQSKIDFAKKVQEELGLSTTPIFNNCEFELENGELVSTDEVIKEAIVDKEGLEAIRERIKTIEAGVQNILAQTDSAINSDKITPERMKEINNIILELEKASMNLGSVVTKE